MMSQSHFGRQMRRLPCTKKESAAKQRNSVSSRRSGSRSIGASNATKNQSHQTRFHQKNRPRKENSINYQPSGATQPPFSAAEGSAPPPGPGTSIHLPSNDEQIEMSQLSMESWGGVESLSQESSSSGAYLGQDSLSSAPSQQQQDRGIAPFNRSGGRPPAYRASQQQQQQQQEQQHQTKRMPPARNVNLISRTNAFNPTAWGPLRLKGALTSVPQYNQFLPRRQQQPRTMTFQQAIQQQANGTGSGHSLFGSVAPAQQLRMPSSSSSNGRTAPHNSSGSCCCSNNNNSAHGLSQNTMNSNSNSSTVSLGSFNSYNSHARGPSQNTTATSNVNNGARSLSQNSHQSSVHGDPYQSSFHTQSTAPSTVSGRSFVASQEPPVVMDKHTIQALIDKTLNSRFAAKTKELDEQQRGFHQRLVYAEEEQEEGLATLQKTIADGLDTLQKTATEAEANIRKSSVENVATLDTKTIDFATLAEDALKRHEKYAQDTEVKASHVDKIYSKVTALVEKAETSALQVKELAKSSVSTITLARDDFQKMVGSFLKGSTSSSSASSSSSSVSSESVTAATVKATPDVAASKRTKAKTTSKKQTSSRPTTRSSAKKDSSSNRSGKNRKSTTAVVTKPASKAKHKGVGARTPLTALKITTTRSSSSSSSKSSKPTLQQPSSPDHTIASCVTPTSHKECRVPATAVKFGTPPKKAGAAASNKPKAVKATRAKKRGRYGRNIAPSSLAGFGFTDEEDNESFGFLS